MVVIWPLHRPFTSASIPISTTLSPKTSRATAALSPSTMSTISAISFITTGQSFPASTAAYATWSENTPILPTTRPHAITATSVPPNSLTSPLTIATTLTKSTLSTCSRNSYGRGLG